MTDKGILNVLNEIVVYYVCAMDDSTRRVLQNVAKDILRNSVLEWSDTEEDVTRIIETLDIPLEDVTRRVVDTVNNRVVLVF